MTPEQALKLLTAITSQVSMPKQGHIDCEIALNTLAKLIEKKADLKPVDLAK